MYFTLTIKMDGKQYIQMSKPNAIKIFNFSIL